MIDVNFEYDPDGDVIEVIFAQGNFSAKSYDFIFDLYRLESTGEPCGLFIHCIKKQIEKGIFYNNHISLFWNWIPSNCQLKLKRTNKENVFIYENNNLFVGVLIINLNDIIKA